MVKTLTNTLSLMFMLAGVAVAGDESLSRYEASQPAMGSVFHIALYAPDDEAARKGFKAAFRRIAALDDRLSDYDPQSELSRLSASSPTEKPIPVSDDLWKVLVTADKYSRASGGAFDVTVGPLTSLWRDARRSKELPSKAELKKALDAVGYRHIRFSNDAPKKSVELLKPNMRLDLGGIAKGYAVDEALDALRGHGITRALVNGGGDIGVSDAPPGKRGWRIGVAPLEPKAAPSTFLLLAGHGVATSGDAWQFVEIDGRRYSHIVDPDNGLGLVERSSVTVVAPDCMSADALASAVSVLGMQDGLKLVEKTPQTEAIVLRAPGGKIVRRASSGFEKLPRAE